MKRAQSVLITGGRRGLGLELCKLFYKNGFEVFATGRNPLEVEKAFKANGIKGHALKLDFAKYTFNQTCDLLAGLPSFSIIIHSASFYNEQKLSTLTEVQADSFSQFISNTLALMKVSAENLARQESGKFFVIGSVVGQFGQMSPERPLYSLYKATLSSMVEMWNLETPKGIVGTYICLGTMQDDPEPNTLTPSTVSVKIIELALSTSSPVFLKIAE